MGDSLKSLNILVAEDAPDNLFLLTLVLEDEGANVVGVENGEKALSALRSQDFDVAILDVSLPDIDGDKIAIKLAEEDNPVKKLALTGHISLGRAAVDAFDLILQKPILPDQLVAAVVGSLND